MSDANKTQTIDLSDLNILTPNDSAQLFESRLGIIYWSGLT